jgi:tetratricopeptide (TPR) repeat protein
MNYQFLLTIVTLTLSFSISAQNNSAEVKGKYLGQKPPGNTAEIFAPGIVSTDAYEHSAPAFSPDGNTVLWTVIEQGKPSYLLEMKQQNDVWTKPAKPSFTDSTAYYIYPAFSIYGRKLYFCSRRKLPDGYPNNVGIRMWEVEKKENGWGTPVPFDTLVSSGNSYAHSMASNGTIYFSVGSRGGTNWNIWYSKKTGDQYQKPEVLPYSINGIAYEDGPFISPDGSYLIYESERPEGIEGSLDLYICFRQEDDTWSFPINMGETVNSKFSERFARVSPDGKYLFFGSNRRRSPNSIGADVYWIDATIIKELRDRHNNAVHINNTTGIELLLAMDSNNNEKAVGLLKKWIAAYPKDMGALVHYTTALRKNKQYKEAEVVLKNSLPEWPGNVFLQMEMMLNLFVLNKNEEAENYIASIISSGVQERLLYARLGQELLAMNKNKMSIMYFEKALAMQQDGGNLYNLACAYAKDNQKNKALETLEKCVNTGYGSRQQIENDPDLNSIKSDERFTMIIEKMKR